MTVIRENTVPLVVSNVNNVVQSNHKRLLRRVCKDLFHARCSGINNIKQIKADSLHELTCLKCSVTELPLAKCSQDSFISLFADDELTFAQVHDSSNVVTDATVHLQALLSRGNQLSIAHLNTQVWYQRLMNFRHQWWSTP